MSAASQSQAGGHRREAGARLPTCYIAVVALVAAALGSAQAAEYRGQATWYPSIYQGSCGYFGNVPKYVAAWPDVQAEYANICGRCFAVTCRPDVVRNADGPWPKIELPRTTQCKTGIAVVVKITDTCPCKGNEQWCCSSNPNKAHLDLSNHAFAEIVQGGDIGIGIIGIDFREVSCDFVGVHPAADIPSLAGGIRSSFDLPMSNGPAAPQQPPAAAAPQQQPEKVQPQTAPEQPAAPAAPATPSDLLRAAATQAAAAKPPQPSTTATTEQLGEFSQCGGAGGACGSRCADTPFEGSACGAGLDCVRQNRFYWQCLAQGGPRDKSWATQAPKRRTDGGCKSWPGLFEQCGGAGGACAQGGQCVDAAWEGACCLEGTCVRRDAYYHQCA